MMKSASSSLRFKGIELKVEPVVKASPDFYSFPSPTSFLELKVADYRKIQQQKQKLNLLKRKEKLNKLEKDYLEYRKIIQQLQQKIFLLKEENISLKSDLKTAQETVEYYEEDIINENEYLSNKIKKLENEKKDLYSKINNLEDEKKAIEKKNEWENKTYQTEIRNSCIDLSKNKLALVGGHPNVQNGIIKSLKQKYNLEEGIKIVSDGKEKQINKNKLRKTLIACDYIVIITGNLSRDIHKIINNLNRNNHLKGNLITVANTRGESGVLREIKNKIS